MWNQINKKSKLLEIEVGKVVARAGGGGGGTGVPGNMERLVKRVQTFTYMMNKV